MRLRGTFALMATLSLVSCGRSSTDGLTPADEATPMTIQVQSEAFSEGAAIPKQYTCDGRNVSPPLKWTGVPESAQSTALICDDPDAPMGTWTHWVLFNLPATVTELKEGMPQNDTLNTEPLGSPEKPAHQGKNDFDNIGYGGPCPPGGTHHYHFKLYALNARLDAQPGATKDQVLRAMKGHVLARGKLMGTFTR